MGLFWKICSPNRATATGTDANDTGSPMSGRPTAAAEDRGALRRRSGRRFIGGSVVVSGERIAPGPPVGVSSLHEAAAYVAGFGETALHAALSRSDPRGMSPSTCPSCGRSPLGPRIHGAGSFHRGSSIYFRKQEGAFVAFSLESHRPLTIS
jgi:hypothetical protein